MDFFYAYYITKVIESSCLINYINKTIWNHEGSCLIHISLEEDLKEV